MSTKENARKNSNTSTHAQLLELLKSAPNTEEVIYQETNDEGHFLPFETDANGFPIAPGTDERDEVHPFDPEVLERIQGDTIEVSPATFLCIAGLGCKFYAECGDHLPTGDGQRWVQPHRICTKFHEGNSGGVDAAGVATDDAGGEWALTDQEMYYCSAYSPRWYDVRGQLRRIGNWVDIWLARDKTGVGFGWYPEVIIAKKLENVTIRLGLKSDLRKEN